MDRPRGGWLRALVGRTFAGAGGNRAWTVSLMEPDSSSAAERAPRDAATAQPSAAVGGAVRRVRPSLVALDMFVLLALGAIGEAAHFSWQQGRHVICADSVQYVDGAEALRSPDRTAHFEFRKPGYSLILACTAFLFGNTAWAAVTVHHLLQAVLPLAAYLLGWNLRSRLVGWLAAILVMAQFQFHYRTERIMSEVPYMTVLTLGVVLCAVGLSRKRQAGWMLGAGLLIAAAWLIRSVAMAVLVAAVACTLWQLRHHVRRTLVACLCLVVPWVGAILLECGLNQHYVGTFKPCTGTLGLTMLIRMRSFEGAPFPDTPVAQWCISLLPERAPEDAYLANKLDGWVAWHRAIRDRGMDEWAFDQAMRSAAFEMIAADPVAYVRTTAHVFARQLLRQDGHPSLSRVPPDRHQPVILPAGIPSSAEARQHWYAHWALPHRSKGESKAIAAQVGDAAEQRAPFGQTGLWADLRYASMLPPVVDLLSVLRGLGSLWPGLALFLCGPLGLNRKTCAFLALSYILGAGIVATTSFSEIANTRFQFVWLPLDTVLAASFLSPVICILGRKCCPD